jgi:hypothetical protein
MKRQNNLATDSLLLRQEAEKLLKKESSKPASLLSASETQKLNHVLEVHQIELELQNEEELVIAKSDAQVATDLFDFAPTGYFTLTNKGQILNINLCASQMLGNERQHLTNKQFGLYISDDTKHVFNLFLDRVFNSQSKETCEVTLLSTEHLTTFVQLIGIEIRQRKHCLVTAIDITERKKAEKTIKDSEKKFRSVIEEAVDVVLTVNLDGYLTYVNPAAEKRSGYSADELKKMKFYDLVKSEYKQRVKRHFFKQYIERSAFSTTKYPIRTRLGDIKWVNQIAQLIIENNEVKGFHAIIRDVSELHEAEIALQESEEKYRLIVENIGEGFGFVNAEEQFLLANKSAEVIFGVESGGLVGKNLNQFVSKDQFSLVQDETELRTQGIQSVYEIDIQRPNNEKRTISVTAVPQNDKDGNFIGTYGIFRDITESIATVQEIKHKNEQLLKLNNEKDKFFSIIAHDLRSPFSSFLGLTQIMAEELPSLTMTEIQDIAVTMKNSATNLYGLLENLLKWSLMQRGLISFTPETVQLKPMVDECLSSLLDPAKNKGIDLICDIPDHIAVTVDFNMFQTIIRNLVSNAVKFTSRGGKISLSAKICKNDNIEISVRDTGIGMSREMIDNLFRPDVKTSRKGTENEPSTGLGLLLCKEFIEKHEGRIWVESEVENGSIFHFTLPYNKTHDGNIFY